MKETPAPMASADVTAILTVLNITSSLSPEQSTVLASEYSSLEMSWFSTVFEYSATPITTAAISDSTMMRLGARQGSRLTSSPSATATVTVAAPTRVMPKCPHFDEGQVRDECTARAVDQPSLTHFKSPRAMPTGVVVAVEGQTGVIPAVSRETEVARH